MQFVNTNFNKYPVGVVKDVTSETQLTFLAEHNVNAYISRISAFEKKQ
jgi:hypothetical protein